ncbi:histidine kinase dimerization/phosphoacceptor domain -containing protein [Desulfocurvus sp.]|jgi:two-component sensor histidine kinase/CheY-like chemotaxis protein|uniref:sensor histidine kinase n=1 Tax=Desulfocurvus sp. TaxID=2871698 RepID=UPI0025BA1BB0|nr:histidine kinase dimerization/phosphoacceptor domain -containing protein [Desulfocurvus sp.]MCK9240743.1 response regulator [Desulfocurvus sp.]
MHTNPKAKILTIDDEDIIRESIEAYLEDSGFAVIHAENGRVGLEVFRRERPDLVLVDLRMPEVDGLDVLAKVTSESPLTPIIVVSGTGVLQDAIEALRLGAWDYVTKPVQDMAVLEHAVTKALERAELLRRKESYSEELEREVRRRTAELSQSNERLNEEIAERLLAEERIRSSLREKEVLLKEIHHRVKNNLQIISSLLYLQSQQIDEERTRELFMESRGRVRSMALVHEKLYQSEDLARINYRDYLASFTRSIMQAYPQRQRTVRLDLHLDDICLPVDMAIPCSLIVNELMTNALKYAFDDDSPGTLTLALRRADDAVELEVRDDGRGFPEGFDISATDTLGMQLVINLVHQIRGALDTTLSPGARFTIRFTPPA